MATWTRAVPLQAVMGGSQEATLGTVVGEGDIFVSFTGNSKTITLDLTKKMRNNAIVGNIEHFDNKIDMDGLEGFPGIKVENIKPQVDRFAFPDGHGVIVLASRRLCNLGCVTSSSTLTQQQWNTRYEGMERYWMTRFIRNIVAQVTSNATSSNL